MTCCKSWGQDQSVQVGSHFMNITDQILPGSHQPESCKRMVLVPTSLLESRLQSINLNPQLRDRFSPFCGVRLQPLGEVAVTGCWARYLCHCLKNNRQLLVQPIVLQRLAAHSSTASISLLWEPHLRLVKVEIKTKGTVLSVHPTPAPPQYLLNPLASISQVEQQ